MKNLPLLILISAIVLPGCQSDKQDSFETAISGYYKIVSIESTVEADLNNDGIRSEDLYDEISSLHYTPGQEPTSFYDFESIQNYMEVRPLPDQTNDAKLIALNIPDQQIDNATSGEAFLSEYSHSFIAYQYELSDRSNKIELKNNNVGLSEEGTILDFELQPDGFLKLEMTKEVFDFVDLAWIETDLTIIYQKVE
ncbi:MAG TPA: hypothetical protein VGK59_11225 [Ohtaekwangia sp.]